MLTAVSGCSEGVIALLLVLVFSFDPVSASTAVIPI